MEQKNIDKCILSLFFNSQYNQLVFYKLERCTVKENLSIYYKDLKYNEFLLLKTIFRSHKLFLNSYKMIRGNNSFYVFSFIINRDKQRLIDMVSNGHFNFLSPIVKKHIFEFTSLNIY